MSSLGLDDPKSLKDYLGSFDLWKGDAVAEGRGYLNHSFPRFMTTLSLVPEPAAGARLLEFGANPYFMSLLLKKFRAGYEFHWANYFGADWAEPEKQHTITSERYEETHRFEFEHFNSELDAFPYPDAHFDYVLYCEIIEHLVKNPSRALSEIHRILKAGGQVLITSPNVVRSENVMRLLANKNIYDPYSGYGIYGRHNREYTARELSELVTSCGYSVDQLVLADLQKYPIWRRAVHGLSSRLKDNLYLLARKTKPYAEGRPAWLYRSFY